MRIDKDSGAPESYFWISTTVCHGTSLPSWGRGPWFLREMKHYLHTCEVVQSHSMETAAEAIAALPLAATLLAQERDGAAAGKVAVWRVSSTNGSHTWCRSPVFLPEFKNTRNNCDQ